MHVTTVGIDLAKKVFQIHGADAKGTKVFSKKISRAKLPEFMATLSPCLVGMEACGSAHYWAREFISMGHEVKLMSPQYVKPYVKTNKSDEHDAEAICEAVTRPNMRFVPIKTIEQQDMKMLHVVRSRLVGNKTALTNQIRGLLAEYGIVINQGDSAFNKVLNSILLEGDRHLNDGSIEIINYLYAEYISICKEIKKYGERIETIARDNPEVQRLKSIPGIGDLSATALLAHIGDAKIFKRGKDLSSFLGLVPKHSGTGGKTKLGGISKRGDRYIRCLLVHGARSVLMSIRRNEDKGSGSRYYQWIKSLLLKLPYNKVVVAVANKNARIVWALLNKQQMFIE